MSTSAESAHRIPSQITLTQLREACKPLLSLLGVTDAEVHLPLVISRGEVSFAVTARPKGDTSDFPTGASKLPDLEASPIEFAELAWPASVTVDINR